MHTRQIKFLNYFNLLLICNLLYVLALQIVLQNYSEDAIWTRELALTSFTHIEMWYCSLPHQISFLWCLYHLNKSTRLYPKYMEFATRHKFPHDFNENEQKWKAKPGKWLLGSMKNSAHVFLPEVFENYPDLWF